MKRIVAFALTAVCLLGLAATAASAQSAQDVLEKLIEAQGGRKALAAVKDQTIAGTMEMIQFGMTGNITLYQKEPNMMRMDIEIMGMIITQAYDGEKAWMTEPQSGMTMEMPEAQAKSIRLQAMGNDALLNPEKLGITYAFKGKEKVGEKDCLVMEQTFKDGTKATLFLDAGTYLPVKSRAKTMDQTGAEVEGETFFDDYRKVDGMMSAFKMTIFQGGTEFGRMTFGKISFNANLEDAFFKMK
jgi:outer membrane lipoprotein-sorting protein